MRKLKKEYDPLLKKVKGILTENPHLKFDLEEFEIKFNAMEKEKTVLEIKLYEAEDRIKEVQTDLENIFISSN